MPQVTLPDRSQTIGLRLARPREGALISNDEVATWVATHPDRFAGLAAVDLAKPMVAVRELRRAVTELYASAER